MKDEDLIDESAIKELKMIDNDGMGGLVISLINLFETSIHQQTSMAKAHFKAGDFAALGQLVHALKSSAGNIGAVALSKVCHEIEVATQDNPKQKRAHILEKLETMIELAGRTVSVLQKYKS